jgi:uncharacterized protein (TIGR04255 family)
MTLPINISPCPILDALLEVRFSSKINSNAVFGLIYSVLQKDFEKVESLPILQLPDMVRVSDPNFKYKPHYRISNNDFVIQIGPDVLSISSFPKYLGWESFSKTIFDVLKKVEELSIINKIERIGLRYINFFENNIFDKINLKVSISSDNILYKNTVVRTEIEQGEFNSTLQIANNAINNSKLGSIIDIDTFSVLNLESFFDNKIDIVNNGHKKEKELFYSLLQSDFLNSLNPKY